MHIISLTSPIRYEKAMGKMDEIVQSVISGDCQETVLLLEHQPVYTVGYTTYKKWREVYGDSLNINGIRVPIIETERGGQITFHGPGQRVCYIIVDLKKQYGSLNLSLFLDDVHSIIIELLAEFGIVGIRDKEYPGVWIKNGNSLDKIAAIGIKVRRGITYHGFSLNINNDLSFFHAIRPCGIADHNRSVTSMSSISSDFIPLESVDVILQQKIEEKFKK